MSASSFMKEEIFVSELRLRKRGVRWEYSFETARVNNKRKSISKGGFRTKAEAAAAGAKAMSEYNLSGAVFVPSEISVADYLDFWMKEYCQNNCKPSTISNYEKKYGCTSNRRLGNTVLLP